MDKHAISLFEKILILAENAPPFEIILSLLINLLVFSCIMIFIFYAFKFPTILSDIINLRRLSIMEKQISILEKQRNILISAYKENSNMLATLSAEHRNELITLSKNINNTLNSNDFKILLDYMLGIKENFIDNVTNDILDLINKYKNYVKSDNYDEISIELKDNLRLVISNWDNITRDLLSLNFDKTKLETIQNKIITEEVFFEQGLNEIFEYINEHNLEVEKERLRNYIKNKLLEFIKNVYVNLNTGGD